ncbi:MULTISPECIES: hypothetical protein [Vibrio]|nr:MULTISPECIES: hypothetical protein [Vibrio]
MFKHLNQYLVFAFALGFAFEFGGQCAWMFVDTLRIAFKLPLG